MQFANANMMSYYDVANSVYSVTMTTIHCCSKLEFGKGHTIKQSPRAQGCQVGPWNTCYLRQL